MTDTNRQIKQMVNFIMQEAHEKVNEIRIKVSSLFSLFSVFLFLLIFFLYLKKNKRLNMILILKNKCLFIMEKLKFKRNMHKKKKI